MSNEEFIDYNRMGEEECTITVRCKSKDLPRIKQALIQAQGCAAGEDVRANRGEGERELKEREEAMRAELTKIAEFVKDIQGDLKETLRTLDDKVKNLGERLEMLEEPAKGLEARAARKDTPIGHDGEDKGKNRRSSRRKKAAAAKAEMDTHRTEEEI